MPPVGQCMSPIEHTVRATDPLSHALDIIGFKHLEHLAVLNDVGQVEAVATDFILRRYSRRGVHEFPVGQVAQKLVDPPPPEADALMVLARQLMEEREATVIVDAQKRPVGMFAEAEALKLAKSVLAPDLTVRDLAQFRDAPCVRDDQPCGDVLRRLFERWDRHVLVLRGGSLAGAVSHRELMGRDEAPVSTIVSRMIRKIRDDVVLEDAINRLLTVPSGCLPVVDSTGRLRGLLTRRHIIDALGRELLKLSGKGAVIRVARPPRR